MLEKFTEHYMLKTKIVSKKGANNDNKPGKCFPTGIHRLSSCVPFNSFRNFKFVPLPVNRFYCTTILLS
jgi:hypothetical protein